MNINLSERDLTAIHAALRDKAEKDRESAKLALAEVPKIEAAEAAGKVLLVTPSGARHIARALNEQADFQDALSERLLDTFYGD